MKTRFLPPPRFFPVLLSVAALGFAAAACDGPRNNETVHPLPGLMLTDLHLTVSVGLMGLPGRTPVD